MLARTNAVPKRSHCPDSGVLFSVADVARCARVTNVTVIRLCLAGLMPEWIEVEGRRYWDRAGAVEAVARIASLMARPARKSA